MSAQLTNMYCENCDKPTVSVKTIIKEDGKKYIQMYCDFCGILDETLLHK